MNNETKKLFKSLILKQISKVDAYWERAYYIALFIWMQLPDKVECYDVKITTVDVTKKSDKKFYMTVGDSRWDFNILGELAEIIREQHLVEKLLIRIF